jgi:hypothetical protein
VYVWKLWKQEVHPSQIKDDWYLLCFGYKWLDEEEIKVISLSDFRGYRSGKDCEHKLVHALYLLLDEADIVIAHNGAAFDVKKINAKFLEYDYQRPAPYKVIDTLKIARRNFRLTSNKLDYIAKFLSYKGKLEHEGMSLWIKCMEGDKDAWGRMKEYTAQDIDQLEKVYLSLRGWDSSHPNLSLYPDDDKRRCISCGSGNLILLEKDAYTNVSTFDCFRCTDCGQVMRSRKRKNIKKEALVGAK